MPIANTAPPTLGRGSRLFALLTTSIYLGFAAAPPAQADHLDDLGMAKLAEMAAFSRHADECPAIPRQWSSALVTLLILHNPPEQQIDEQEQQALALRDRIGQAKWCKLYETEMKEAFLIFRMATER